MDTLTVTELEGLLRQEEDTVPTASPETLSFSEPVDQDFSPPSVRETVTMMPGDLLSIDKALYLLASGRADALVPYLGELMRQVQPLLDLARKGSVHKST